MTRRLPFILAAALLLPTAALAQPVAPGGTTLEIVARGDVQRRPDLASITAGVVSQGASAAAAMADNARAMTAVIGALKQAGIAAADIRTASLSLQPTYRTADNQPPTIAGYEAGNEVTVTLHDPARAGAVVDELASKGVNRISGPTFGLEHPDAALDEARVEAMRSARVRADLYARAAGLTVRRIVSISEQGSDSGAPPPRPMIFAAMAKRETPIEAGQQDLSVTVQVTFELGQP